MDKTAKAGWEKPFLLRYAQVLLEICFFIHLTCCLIGWDRLLDDFHAFRQCQTALGAYYTLKDGFHLAYETPVLGKPWSIPMEFPLYQWWVAATCLLFHTPLDQTGRFWSLAFFYLSLFPLYSLLGLIVPEKEKRFLILCLVLLNPIYLFWSRTFLMESLALFLGLGYLWASAKGLESGKRWRAYLALAVSLGILCAMVKVTTWVVYGMGCGVLIARAWIQGKGLRRGHGSSTRLFQGGTLLLGVPCLAALGWARFADSLKRQNPLADGFLTSDSPHQFQWIFGDWAQRVSPSTWGKILGNTHCLDWPAPGVSDFPFLLVLALVVWLALPGRRIAPTLCLACWAFPFLVFTNLYQEHDYYQYANGLFLSAFLGLTLLALIEAPEKNRWREGAVPFLFLTAAFSLGGYGSYYHIVQKWVTPTETVAKVIRENTDEKGVILIYGLDWNPTIPYYSQRRALMDRWDMPLEDPKMRKAVQALGEDRIQGMLVYGRENPILLLERAKFFGLSLKAYVLGDFLFFPKNSGEN